MKTTCPSALRAAVLGIALLATTSAHSATAPAIEFPAPSPAGTVKQRVGITDIEINYSRPSVKGRKIFGGLEPYGAVWRTGANSPTKISFSTPVRFGGQEVPAGTYGLYSIPGEREWVVILNRVDAKDWGAYGYKSENDVARATVKPVGLNRAVETFTIDIDEIRTESAMLTLAWEKTLVPVKLEFEVMSALGSQVEKLMASDADKKPYFEAAMFYFENGGDLKKALEWIDAGLSEQPDAFYMIYRKGLILAKLGDKAGARAAAEQSKKDAIAKAPWPSLRDEYVRLNDALIESLK